MAASGAVVGAGPQEQPVDVGAAGERAMVGVADGEGARQRTGRAGPPRRSTPSSDFSWPPAEAHAAVVPGLLGVGPGVRRAGDAHGLEGRARVQAERQHGARAAVSAVVVLRPDAAAFVFGAGGNRNGEAVAEAAHAGQAAEIMVERAVLLHEDHDVFDVAQRAAAPVGFDRQRPSDGRGKQAERAGGARERGAGAQEVASVRHEASSGPPPAADGVSALARAFRVVHVEPVGAARQRAVFQRAVLDAVDVHHLAVIARGEHLVGRFHVGARQAALLHFDAVGRAAPARGGA